MGIILRYLRYLLIFSLSALFVIPSYGQRKKNTKKADLAYETGEYYKAQERYKKVLSRTRNKEQRALVAFKLGECYRNLNMPSKAAAAYSRAVKFNYADPVAMLYSADALKMIEEYEDAQEKYDEYAKLVPDDQRARKGKQACEQAIEWAKEPTRYIVEAIKDINSKQYDYAPAIASDLDVVYFTTSRGSGKGTALSKITGEPNADIFVAKVDRKGDWNTPVPLTGKVNTPFDEGTPVFVNDGNTMYYTGCPEEKKAALGCRIYMAQKEGADWGAPALVDLEKDSNVTVAHPAVSRDQLTLIFSSDKQKGKGGKDLWISTRKTASDPWEEPKNMGFKINTENDEMYPHIRSNDTIYFASNGHNTIGGLDIFIAVKDKEGKWEVENMKVPINSPADDFAITFFPGEEKGYFSSTRQGGRGGDDIWKFELPILKFSLEGQVEEEESRMPLGDVLVQLLGSDGTSLEMKTQNDGKFKFRLNPNVDYIVVTKKEFFLNGKGSETTKNLTEDKVLKMLIAMPSTKKPIVLPNIFYDLNEAKLREESKVSLDKLVETLNDNPITIELAAHTDYRATDEYNNKLSQARAQSVIDYLIEKGIDPNRLTPKGYGETVPKTITRSLSEQYTFLKEGDILTEEFITKLEGEEKQEICNQINRRTEFSVLSTGDEKTIYFGKEEKKEEYKEIKTTPEDKNDKKVDEKSKEKERDKNRKKEEKRKNTK